MFAGVSQTIVTSSCRRNVKAICFNGHCLVLQSVDVSNHYVFPKTVHADKAHELSLFSYALFLVD